MCGGPVIWRYVKHSLMTNSSNEAEFVSASLACRETMWLRQLLTEMKREPKGPTDLWLDNKGAIENIISGRLTVNNKHIDIKYMFAKHAHADGIVSVKYVQSSQQVADIFTKALCEETFVRLRSKMGMGTL